MSFDQVDPRTLVAQIRGPVADPAISLLLRRDLLAQIKYRQLEMEIMQVQQYIEVLEVQKDMLAKEFDIR